MYGLTNEEFALLDALAIHRLKSNGATVWLFGSRSRGDHKKYSDIDLLYMTSTPLPRGLIFDITSDLEDSNLPYKVDLVNVQDLADSYKENVFRDRKAL
jgi:predicted nucleotidyltransferase